MDLSGIISVSGMGGLHKVVAQIKNGLIVEALADKKRIPIYATHKVSTLEDVKIYSSGDDVPLKDVFQKIADKENGGPAMDHKSPDADLKKYFKTAFPEYDEERVYVSDIKKVINWYNLLQKEGLLEKKVEKTEEEKPKLKTPAEAPAGAKTKLKETKARPVKTASSKVKTQGVRKTGVA